MLISRNRLSSISMLIILLFILTLVCIPGYVSFKKIEKNTNSIIIDIIPLGQAEDDLLSQLVNEETGVRGYIVTGNKEFLDPYYLGKEKLENDIKVIDEHKHNISVTPNLRDLGENEALQQIGKIQLYFESQISLIKSGKFEEARSHLKEGKSLMDQYRHIHEEFKGNITEIIDTDWNNNKKEEERSQTIIFMGFLSASIIGFLSYLLFTQARKIENNLKQSEERYRQLVELSPEPIGMHQDGKLIFINRAGAKVLGATCSKDLIGKPIREIISQDDSLEESMEQKLIRLDGKIIHVELTEIQTSYEGRPAFQMVFRDITERKKAEKLMKQMAYYDPLTELPNRRLFEERVSHVVGTASVIQEMISVMFLDLDDFKQVNDTFGHNIGDLLLREVGKLLSSCIRKEDTVARLAGDEFTILLPNVTCKETILIAERILSVLDEPLMINGGKINITPSIGISFYPKDTLDAKELIKHADIAMYQAKQQGKKNYYIYQSADILQH